MSKSKKSLPVGPSTIAYKPSQEDIQRERRYRAQDALSTLQRAEEIKKDKSLMKDCKQYVKDQAKTVAKIIK